MQETEVFRNRKSLAKKLNGEHLTKKDGGGTTAIV
jgi:hypothetical protein